MGNDPARNTETLALRLPTTLLDKIDAHAASINAEYPFMKFNRSVLLRLLLNRALESAETTMKETGCSLLTALNVERPIERVEASSSAVQAWQTMSPPVRILSNEVENAG